MSWFHKSIDVFAPISGNLKSIEQVDDEMFSSKAMGDGFAIEPKSNIIVSPIIGEVVSIFPTKHALSLKTKNNLEVLLHIGIDTVELNGKGFNIKVNPGDSINPDTIIADIDFEYIKSQEKLTDVIVVFTNLDKKNLELKNNDTVKQGQNLGMIS